VSQENVEIVRALAEAFGAATTSDLFDFFAADIEWDASLHTVPDLVGVYRGHEGVGTAWRRWLSAWRDLEFEFELRDAGNDVVMLIRNQRQFGRHSGIATEAPPYAMVFTLRAGKVVRFRIFPDHESALRAVGLGD
jgi:ketosteroid isomerase-like protein